MKKLILIFILSLTTIAFSQTKISGKVTDASTGDPIPGASVIIENTTIGTSTDFDGNFSLEGNTSTYT
jgi:hypothetical protein